jgi:BASS family bile acid:Na+ symporter
MSVQEIISFALKASLFGLVLSVGLESRWSDFTYVLRRPALLLRAILAVHVVVPAIVIGLCLLLPIASWTKAGLVMMAVSPLAPLAPIKMLKGAAREYAVGTTFALMLVATVAVPLTAEALRPLTTNHVKIPLTMVTLIVGTTVLLPLAIGVWAHGEWETFSERLAPLLRKAALAIIIPIALLILVPIAALILVRFWREFVPLLGDGTLAVIAVAAASALVFGYALGGPDQANRKALAEAAATRHPGLAAAIAPLHSNDPRILAAILLYMFASAAFSLAFGPFLFRAAGHSFHSVSTADQ